VKLEDIHNVYFLGLGGIGMSALARWFKAQGFSVYGYDKTHTKLTEQLENEGIKVHYEDSIKNIPSRVKSDKHNTLVIYTPAIPKDHQEMSFLKINGYTIKKRSEVLGILTQNKFTIAVAGTHGKTTTSSMIAHILRYSGVDSAAFLGGITQNYGTNFLINNNENAPVVVEADEYDRSFLTLAPNIAVVTSTDADHLDIYGEEGEVLKSFNDFVCKVKEGGKLFLQHSVKLEKAPLDRTKTYSLNAGYLSAGDIRIENGDFHYNLLKEGKKISDITLQVPGFHNVENSLAASAVALELNISVENIKGALASYKGVKRRFEYILRTDKIIQIDDYAHHPTEIQAFIKSAKALYPNKKLTVIFQPHLFSRTRDFAEEFSKSLSLADEVILMEIYPARELPIEGINSELLLSKMTISKKQIARKGQILDIIKNGSYEVIATVGAGDIDQLIEPIKNILIGNYHV
jgi:UDP-N-acetylmuramate--alanine ligase